MATGDNVLTAISVARQCAILNQESEVWLADVVTDKRTGDEQIEWKSSLPNLQDPNQVNESKREQFLVNTLYTTSDHYLLS